ncbi:MAG: ABC transporter substrate-binding protein [bacterium]|nr:ABC transporter substrate-binding protein [bacterium]
MKRALGVAGLLMACALAGCAGAQQGAANSSTLVQARVKDAVSLDPAVATDGLSLNVSVEAMRGLLRFKAGTFDVGPSIAKDWHSQDGGRVWLFDLKPDLKFSDGTPLDAAAVKFNFDRWREPKNPYAGTQPFSYYISMFGGQPGIIRGVDVVSPTQVRFTLSTPFGPFLRDLAMPSFAIGSPTAIKADPQAFAQKPVGYGPYTVGEWVHDDHITLKANPAFDDPKPAYQTVVIRDIPDQATSVLEAQKGSIDGLSDPRPEDAKALAKDTALEVYQQPANNVAYLALNLEKKPFDDPRVRRAIAYALDLHAIVGGLYGKGAEVANTWVPDGMDGSSAPVKAYPHDIAKAKALLAQAGLPHGFSTQLYYGTAPRPYLPEPQRIAEAIQAQLKQAGINLTLEPFEWAVYLQKIKNGEHPMCLIGWTGDNGDADNFLYTLLDQDSAVKGAAQNYSFWRDPKFHALMLAGQRTVDESKRQAIYVQAVRLVHDQVPAIPLVHTTVPIVWRRSVAGYVPNADSIVYYELMHPAEAK